MLFRSVMKLLPVHGWEEACKSDENVAPGIVDSTAWFLPLGQSNFRAGVSDKHVSRLTLLTLAPGDGDAIEGRMMRGAKRKCSLDMAHLVQCQTTP